MERITRAVNEVATRDSDATERGVEGAVAAGIGASSEVLTDSVSFCVDSCSVSVCVDSLSDSEVCV